MRTEKYTLLNGDKCTVREQTMRVILPILEGDPAQRGLALMKASIFDCDRGELLGDGLLDLGFRDYNTLQLAVLEVYGLNEGVTLGNAP